MKKIYSFILIISVCLSAWAQSQEFKARLVNPQKEASPPWCQRGGRSPS